MPFMPTERHIQIASFVQSYRAAHHMSPLIREIAEELGVAKVTVHEHLRIMRERGMLAKSKPYFDRQTRISDSFRRWRYSTEPLTALREAWRNATPAQREMFIQEIADDA